MTSDGGEAWLCSEGGGSRREAKSIISHCISICISLSSMNPEDLLVSKVNLRRDEKLEFSISWSRIDESKEGVAAKEGTAPD